MRGNGKNFFPDRTINSRGAQCVENIPVGAIIDRPPKIFDFRISRREITVFSPYGDGFCSGKIRGRSVIAPTIDFFDTLSYPAGMTPSAKVAPIRLLTGAKSPCDEK